MYPAGGQCVCGGGGGGGRKLKTCNMGEHAAFVDFLEIQLITCSAIFIPCRMLNCAREIEIKPRECELCILVTDCHSNHCAITFTCDHN